MVIECLKRGRGCLWCTRENGTAPLGGAGEEVVRVPLAENAKPEKLEEE